MLYFRQRRQKFFNHHGLVYNFSMKKITIILLFLVSSLYARDGSVFKLGANSSMIIENGNAYPVIGITAGFYPVPFFFVEGSGEYIMKQDAQELSLPLTINFAYPSRYFRPYAGIGASYHFLNYPDQRSQTLGGRLKAGVTLFDTKNASGAFEITYEVPDIKTSKGRWYFTGRIDKGFNLAF